MATQPLHELLSAVAAGLCDAQLALDERGRDSIDAFGDTGVPPTVFTYSRLALEAPLRLTVTPRTSVRERTRLDVRSRPGGSGRMRFALDYVIAPQGGDDPGPRP